MSVGRLRNLSDSIDSNDSSQSKNCSYNNNTLGENFTFTRVHERMLRVGMEVRKVTKNLDVKTAYIKKKRSLAKFS